DSPAAIVERCNQAMEQISSFAVKGTLAVGVEGLLNTAVYDAFSAKVFAEPLKAHVLFQAMGTRFEAYAQELDGKLYLYENSGSRWDGQTLEMGLNAAELTELLTLAEGLRAEKAEPVNGKEAWRLSADINLRQWMTEEDIDQAVGMALGPQAMGLFPPYEPVIISVAAFVEVETGYLARVEIDLSEFASRMLTLLTPNQPGMQSKPLVAEIKIGLDFMDWNNVADFEVPAEARAK
ncbi:MAG: hypothetical protein FWD25_05875, partial [Clostridia bacterium]|nr:hypothetical protein [Clostridia bacterium]